MEKEIENIIQQAIGSDIDLNEYINCDLIEEGIMDSLSFIILIQNIEDKFNIEISPTQVPPDVWRSVKKIKELIYKRMEEANEK